MGYSSLIVMALVWGGLLVYFLTPFQRKSEKILHIKINFADALKNSFVKVTFHKKAILAFTLIMITLLATWWSQNQNKLYNEIHGISSQTQPFNYQVGIIIYSAIIYFLLIGRNTIKLFKNAM